MYRCTHTVAILKGWTVMFPLPELPLGTSINSIEWKYHTREQRSRIYSKRTGMQIMENVTLNTEDVKDEDSGNYSCTVISLDRKMWIKQIYLHTFLFYFTTQKIK